jgi:hypothetical protein
VGNEETQSVKIDEIVVLSKFDGNSTDPQDEFERVTINNGTIVSHDRIENGEVVGAVENSEIIGQDIGRLIPSKE